MTTEHSNSAPNPQGVGSQSKARRQMLAIMGIALVSLAGSYLLYYTAKDGEGWGTTNKGAFVTPPMTLENLNWQVTAAEGPVGQYERAWYLWTVAQQCDAGCQQMVKDLRALHILLNREAERVRRGYSTLDGAPPGAGWLDQFPQLKRIAWQRDEVSGELREGVYIVDPIGNLVFYYSLEANPKSIQADLKRLLKVSQIG